MRRPDIGDKVMDVPTGDVGRVVSLKAETRRHVIVCSSRYGYTQDVAIDRLRPFTGSLKKIERRAKAMTYTLAKMSGKAVRLAARLLAVVKLGGKLDDTPDKFYDRAMEESGLSRIELERKFGIATDKFEERIRDEEGFIGDNLAVFDQVRKKLGEGFYLQGEVAHDHHINGGGDESRKAKKTRIPEADKGNVKKLLKRLRNTTDKTEARKLRRQLRRLGHRGGKGGK